MVKLRKHQFTQASSDIVMYQGDPSDVIIAVYLERGTSTGTQFAWIQGMEQITQRDVLLHINVSITGGVLWVFYF